MAATPSPRPADEHGAVMLEYGLVATLVAVAAALAVAVFGGAVAGLLTVPDGLLP